MPWLPMPPTDDLNKAFEDLWSDMRERPGDYPEWDALRPYLTTRKLSGIVKNLCRRSWVEMERWRSGEEVDVPAPTETETVTLSEIEETHGELPNLPGPSDDLQ